MIGIKTEVVISTLAIDTPSNRSNERLTMFLTEIGADKPIDNYFDDHPAWDLLMSKKQMKTGGRQIGFPINSGENPTVQDFADDDTFIIEVPDTALWVAYPYVNKGGSVVVLEEELRETDGADHKVFDVLEHRRETLLLTVFDKYSTDLFAASQVAGKINSLNTIIDSTGAVGGLNQSTDADWASTETGSGSFASQGLADMRTLYNTLRVNKSKVDAIVTTQTVYEAFENEIDPDVRYDTVQVGERGFTTFKFKGVPIIFDADCTSGVLYMWDSRYLFLSCDTGWNFDFEPFMTSFEKKLRASKFANRCNLVTTNRRTAGKLTGITA